MKRASEYRMPAEAGYYTNTQWESAFKTAFDVLRSDAQSRTRFSQSRLSKHINDRNRKTQEETHGQVR